jgi:hypothetical protein
VADRRIRNERLNGLPWFGELKSIPKLKLLWCDYVPERDADLLRDVKSLERINDRPAAELLKGSNEKP